MHSLEISDLWDNDQLIMLEIYSLSPWSWWELSEMQMEDHIHHFKFIYAKLPLSISPHFDIFRPETRNLIMFQKYWFYWLINVWIS